MPINGTDHAALFASAIAGRLGQKFSVQQSNVDFQYHGGHDGSSHHSASDKIVEQARFGPDLAVAQVTACPARPGEVRVQADPRIKDEVEAIVGPIARDLGVTATVESRRRSWAMFMR